VTVSHNPTSNLMLGSGVMPLRGCARCGLRVALGTDSSNTGGRHDLFGVMRLAMMLPRRDGGDPADWPTGRDMLRHAAEAGAAALGLAGQVGRIAPGQLADLVLVERRSAATLAWQPGVEALVQHGGPEAVLSVMVGGRWVMRDRHIATFDEAAVVADADRQISALRARVARSLPALEAHMPELMSALGRNGDGQSLPSCG
jgi:5-methylthioadenosine/S-adenosylhomocysteine deaminase